MVKKMTEEKLVKIELGCGATKADGFIGVDRFELPGVDVVADLEKPLPFPDNYADVIYACHSLEHITNFEQLMREVYRISKHRALVLVLAPYNRTTLNSANFYHKTAFNENTFRFFTSNPISPLKWEEYKCEHAKNWGLKGSDNSDCEIELTSLKIEFFYYPEYRDLLPEEKCKVRHALNDVCDQIYYVLAVNKSVKHFTSEEQADLLSNAKWVEPEHIQKRRTSEKSRSNSKSILKDISETNKKMVDEAKAEIQIEQQRYESALRDVRLELRAGLKDNSSKRAKLENELETIYCYQNLLAKQQETSSKSIGELYTAGDEVKCAIESIQKSLEDLCNDVKALNEKEEAFISTAEGQIRSLSAHFLECNSHRRKKPYNWTLFGNRFGPELFSSLRQAAPQFIDGLIMHGLASRRFIPLTMSNFIPFASYLEYSVKGYGNKLNFFIVAVPNSQVLIEIVSNGHIIDQKVITAYGDGVYQIEVTPILGKAYVRFRLLDNFSLIRVLEASRRVAMIFHKRTLACYISE